MSVSNNTPANQTTFNAAFLSRTTDSTTTGKVGLANTDPVSGPAISNTQRAVNETFEAVGITGEGDLTANDYGTNERGIDTLSRKDAIAALDQAFALGTGHNHGGGPGEGALISAGTLADFNTFFAYRQYLAFTGATGSSVDVTSVFTGLTPGGTTSAVGVVTSAPNNLAILVDTADGTQIENGSGKRVYGRLTESAGTWTLDLVTLSPETTYSLPGSTNIGIYFLEVFNQDTRPTFTPDSANFGTVDLTADVVDATTSVRGVVSTGSQQFAGAKDFTGNLLASAKVAYGQTVDSTTTGAAQTLPNPATGVVVVTDPGLTSLTGAASSYSGQFFILMNGLATAIDLLNEVGTASEQFVTGTGADLTVQPGASVLLARDNNITKWRIIGGSGGGAPAVNYHKTERLRINYADLVAQGPVATTITVPYTIPALCVLKSITAKVQTAFTFGSGSPADLLFDVGNNGQPTEYIASFDVLSQPVGTFESAMTSNLVPSNNTIVVQTTISSGATLDEINAGLLDIYVEYYDGEAAPIDATLAMS